MRRKTTITYSIEKVAEGGHLLQREAITEAKRLGAKAKRAYSPYVGQYGVEVEATEAVHRKLERLYFRGIWPSIGGTR